MGWETVLPTRSALSVLVVGSDAVARTVAAVGAAAGGTLIPTRAASAPAALTVLATSRFDCVITEIDALDPADLEGVRALRAGAAGAAVVVVCDDVASGSDSRLEELADLVLRPGELAAGGARLLRHASDTARLLARLRTIETSPADGLEAELVHHTMHDGLTGLPNRTYLTYRLVRELVEARRTGDPVAVLVTDLDQFRAVDELHGHLVGDRVLVEVAERMRALVRPTDIVARAGGDEFVLVCPGTGEAAAALLAGQMIEAVGRPIELEHRTVRVGVSVGIAVSPPVGGGAAKLLKHADLALYEAKSRGRSQAQIFDASLAERSRDLLQLTEDLRAALAGGTLDVRYQPIVDVARGGLAGHEALARWQHPVRGEVSPDLFVRLAEQGGFVAELDRWVLTRSCRDVRTAVDAGSLGADTRISVNLSAQSLADPALSGWVRELLESVGLSPQSLVLEITETAVVQDVASAGSALADLRALGVGVALDDFGTGYSSLTLLRELPVTQVKVDRSFVANLGAEHRGDLFITESVIDLARRLGLETVAEGVETPDQLAVLRRLGCDCAQGHLWSGALPADQLGTPLVVPTAASARRRRTLRRREHPQGDVGSNAS